MCWGGREIFTGYFLELLVKLKMVFEDAEYCEAADCQIQNLLS